ncbi:hypothetical protein F4779DRAFT_624318 [Xylariaceae sp. FL0662B]|nr:hypothetical protein F4779DRAFT_624318 [Xylariaceae sp. FL0662B]
MASKGKYLTMQDQKQSMLDVCSSVDVATLQQLFIEHGIQTGSKPIRTQYIIPSTDELFERAVASKQITVVNFILRTYPSLTLNQSHGVVSAVRDNPDPVVLQALCDYERNFASF